MTHDSTTPDLCLLLPASGGRHQPFYNVLPDPEDRPGQAQTYVAQASLLRHASPLLLPLLVLCLAAAAAAGGVAVAAVAAAPPVTPPTPAASVQENVVLEALPPLHACKPGERGMHPRSACCGPAVVLLEGYLAPALPQLPAQPMLALAPHRLAPPVSSLRLCHTLPFLPVVCRLRTAPRHRPLLRFAAARWRCVPAQRVAGESLPRRLSCRGLRQQSRPHVGKIVSQTTGRHTPLALALAAAAHGRRGGGGG